MTSPTAPRETEVEDCSCETRGVIHCDCDYDRLAADMASVQAEYKSACHLLGLTISASRCPSDRPLNEHVADQAAQIERLTQELEPLRIRQRRMDIQELRVLIDGYQGTCFPLNRTSLHGLFDEIERQAQEIAALREIEKAARSAVGGSMAGTAVLRDKLADLDAFRRIARLDAAPAEAQG